jgi:hypothetical protein
MAQNEDDSPRPRAIENWRARRRRKRVLGALKFLVFVGILGAAAGLGVRYWPLFRAWLRPAQTVQVPTPPAQPPPTDVRPPPPPPPLPPKKPVELPPQKVDVPKALPPPKRVVIEADEQRAQEMLTRSRQALEQLKFGEARQLADQAGGLRAEDKTLAEARLSAHQAEQYDLAARHIPVSDFAGAETSWRLRLREGGEMRGLLVREDAEELVFQRVSDENPAAPGIQRVTLPRTAVFERAPVSVAERQDEFRSLLRRLEQKLSLTPDAPPAEYYDLVFLSKRLGLARECLDYLNKAYAKAQDGALGNVFRNLVVARALESASLLAVAGRRVQAEAVLRELTQRTLPDFEPARDAVEAFRVDVLGKIRDDYRSTLSLVKRGSAPRTPASPPRAEPTARQLASAASTPEGGADEEIVVDSSSVTGRGQAASIVEQANKCYEEGLGYYRQYRQGTTGDNNRVLAKAEELLRKAVDLYGRALELDANNKAIADRQLEANMIVYACAKYRTL